MKKIMTVALLSALMIMPMMAQEKTEAPKSCPNHEWHQAHQVKPMNDTAIAMKKAEILKSKLELTDVQYEKAVDMYLNRMAQHREKMAQHQAQCPQGQPAVKPHCKPQAPQSGTMPGHCQQHKPMQGQCSQHGRSHTSGCRTAVSCSS